MRFTTKTSKFLMSAIILLLFLKILDIELYGKSSNVSSGETVVLKLYMVVESPQKISIIRQQCRPCQNYKTDLFSIEFHKRLLKPPQKLS